MNQYFQTPSQLGVRPAARLATGLVSQSLAWMFAGLAITAVVSWVVASDASLAGAARTLVLPGIIVQLGLVIAISALIKRLSATLALGLFFVYAALTGFVFSILFVAYTGPRSPWPSPAPRRCSGPRRSSASSRSAT